MKTKEFANLCGVEKRTLFHYDQIGLLKPQIVHENGYREYSIEQVQEMDMIKIFQSCGYKLIEIKEIINFDNKSKHIEIDSAINKLNHKIFELKEMRSFLHKKKELLNDYYNIGLTRYIIKDEILHYDYKEVNLENHFFSFLCDGSYSNIMINSNNNYYICKFNSNGKYTKSGKSISFFIEVPTVTPNLEFLITKKLYEYKFISDNDFFIETFPHFLNADRDKAILKVITFQKTKDFTI